MKQYIRNCPQCESKLEYKTASGYYKGNKENRVCRLCYHKNVVGRKHSEETKFKIKNALTDIVRSKEWGENISKGKLGHKWTEKTRETMK